MMTVIKILKRSSNVQLVEKNKANNSENENEDENESVLVRNNN